MERMIAKLTKAGLPRVLDGEVGMTFIVDKLTEQVGRGKVAHVRDYRYPDSSLGRKYQIWSIGPDGYEIIA